MNKSILLDPYLKILKFKADQTEIIIMDLMTNRETMLLS